MSGDLAQYKKRDFREKQFWQQLDPEFLIGQSEPPQDYPTPMDVNDKNNILLRHEN